MSRLIHYAFDAALLSVAFAGAKRAAGVEFNPQKIENETARSIVQQYLGLGDWVVDYTAVKMRQSEYFTKK
ncbi:hypothetical protein HDU76_012327 [Blyttiomyces sp. JEL0837]|nr:hypothetical protein HDU76_012327 [Blyttiomyces sp. JEL0837]